MGALVFGLALTGSARADLLVTLNSTSSPTTSGNGTIPFSLVDGGFVSSGTGKGETGLGSPATMDLSAITVMSSAPGTATIIFSMNNINSPTAAGLITETVTGHFISGSGSISYTTYGDNTNTLNTTNPGGPNSGTVSQSGTVFGGSSSGAFTAAAPYSLTEVLTITFNGSGMVSLSTDTSAQFVTPEPASMALALSAAAGMGGYGWKRRRKVA